MNACPSCEATLKPFAVSCRCGWKLEAEDPRPRCSQCPSDATYKLKIEGRWRDLCKPCYYQYLTAEAVGHCESMGLHTVDQMREWLKNNKERAAENKKKYYAENPEVFADARTTRRSREATGKLSRGFSGKLLPSHESSETRQVQTVDL